MTFDPTSRYDASFNGIGFVEAADQSGRFGSIGAAHNDELTLEYPGSDDVDIIDLGDRPVEFQIRGLVDTANKDAIAALRKTTHTLVCSQGNLSVSAYLKAIDAIYVANFGIWELTMSFRRS